MRELSLHVLDIAENSITAGASLVEIAIEKDTGQGVLSITITDDGKGMTEEQVKQVIDPFYTTRKTRKVGLGIPLFKMAAEMTGGTFSIASKPGLGTKISARFLLSSVDLIPLGDINATISLLIRCNPDRDFVYRRKKDSRSFTLETRQLREVLGNEVSLASNDVMQWIDEFLKEQTQIIFGGANLE